MVIAKTASRNVAFKAARLGDSIFDRQSEILITEAVMVNSATSKNVPNGSQPKKCFFSKMEWWVHLVKGKMVSIDKISASISKFENLRWTPYYY